MVPQARIGLASRPYQGRVLPLYYWGNSRDYTEQNPKINNFIKGWIYA